MGNLVKLFTAMVVAGIIVEEIKKEDGVERWKGKSLGFVPYDLRPPALSKIKESYWDTSTNEVFSGKVSGIGWAINFAALRNLLSFLK
ncbi:MAG: hypothetical protein ACJ0OL_03880 [Dehalococcoidia bacterium]